MILMRNFEMNFVISRRYLKEAVKELLEALEVDVLQDDTDSEGGAARPALPCKHQCSVSCNQLEEL